MKRRALAAALACCALGLSWQWLTVHYNYGGNWTALFCHGSDVPLPAALAGEHIYVFPHSGGYDGQSYHFIAHDPLARGEIGRAVPDPALRFPRILVPGMAYLLAMGQSRWVDPAFECCVLLFVGLGAYWLSQLLAKRGVNEWFAVLYVAVPAVIVSLDRMVIDVAFTSLALGFAVYVGREEGSLWKLWVVLAAAALCRETGFLLFGGYAIRLLALRRVRRLAWFATAVIPAVVWVWWVRSAIPGAGAFGVANFYPLWGMMQAVLHPRHYEFAAAVVAAIVGLWWLQFAGLLLGIGLSLRGGLGSDAVGNACFLWACFAIVLPPGVYDDPFAGARVLGALLLFQFVRGGWGRVPLLMVAPRVWLELGAQALGILRGI